MLGHDQQIVAIVPSRNLVIVRLGLSRTVSSWEHARDLAPIVQAMPPFAGPLSCGQRVEKTASTYQYHCE